MSRSEAESMAGGGGSPSGGGTGPSPEPDPLPQGEPVPKMTVIVAVGNLRRRAGGCLRSLLDQGLGERMEILLLDCSRPGSEPVPYSDTPSVRIVEQPEGTLFSTLRARGVAAARAPVVSFLEEHVRVRPGWAEATLAAFRDGWDGVGSTVVPANPGVDQADAVGLVSYGLWYPPLEGGEAAILPGHNASYRREVLLALGDDLERLLHADVALQQRLVREGRRLYLEPAAVIEHLNEGKLRHLARGIFLWYRCYGPLRATEGNWSFWRRALYVVATPLIPLYFLIGFGRHLRRRRSPDLALLLRHAPGVLQAQLWGAAGQALGLLFGEGDAPARFTDYELHQDRPH